MSVTLLHTRAVLGIDAPEVQVETHLSPGLPGFSIVGLPEAAVRESRDRVRSALINSGFEFPTRRITVNLAPADLPKGGGRYDLPIALGILAASGQLRITDPDAFECLGELALGGELRPGHGVLPAALAASRSDRALIVPCSNAAEAALAHCAVHGADSLLAVCAHLEGREIIAAATAPAMPGITSATTPSAPCLRDVRGQHQARRALEIAAAGGHSLLLSGPPGSGKSMLAQRLPGLLPPLDNEAALEVAAVHSLHRSRALAQFHLPPFRSPHHTASAAALVGGGGTPCPGEISLAHRGVLFLDELPEFNRQVLEVLREPLETGEVHISRARAQARFPAHFQLVAAMNPCPCGWLGDPARSCGYFCDKARRYQQKLSGPLLDRIDLHLDVEAVPAAAITSQEEGEASASVRERVIAARQRQLARQDRLNSQLDATTLAPWLHAHRHWLQHSMEQLGLSARSLHRLIRVARTLADLAGEDVIRESHLLEALSYRPTSAAPPA
ncbi:MAG: YifB family Mg chelatase-like AAA ATPase [Alcanivorax sp.]|nr:YifB family Mg chelatase-like AAA ATPase [Alcanivorax sp.]